MTIRRSDDAAHAGLGFAESAWAAPGRLFTGANGVGRCTSCLLHRHCMLSVPVLGVHTRTPCFGYLHAANLAVLRAGNVICEQWQQQCWH